MLLVNDFKECQIVLQCELKLHTGKELKEIEFKECLEYADGELVKLEFHAVK